MRVITRHEHPDNVAVFDASSIPEAVVKASNAMALPSIQAALWINRAGKIDLSRDAAFRREFRKVMKHGSYVNDGIGKSSVQITLELKASQGKQAPVTIGYRGQDFNFATYVDDRRQSMMRSLSTLFSIVRLGIRHELKSNYRPHIDSDGEDAVELDVEKLFQGRRVRILDSRAQSGTYVYARDDTDAREPWLSPLHAPLFIGGDDWGRDKAILHTAPIFQGKSPDKIRVLDVYDCFSPNKYPVYIPSDLRI